MVIKLSISSQKIHRLSIIYINFKTNLPNYNATSKEKTAFGI